MKVFAVASMGGHWIQLLRLKPAFEGMEVVFVSNNKRFSSMVPGEKFYAVADGNRNSKLKLIRSFYEVLRIIKKERPDVIVTTGAAPGLMALLAGKLLGIRTVWIDSIANVERLSMSGKIALKIAGRVYTQWEDLATDQIHYAGNVLL
ncbi:glycosyltransferase [Niabella sp.]|uniref:glycosyltransferase n=1 Tax=Niabella sp. TaxID=1962976 RepID=UPI00261F225B|nr:glycosyltransferase [Niabella sp.]